VSAEAPAVRGRAIPAPRPTAWAGIVLVSRYGLPLIAAGFALDLALWLTR
jgi:hypothetical protein